jgi:N-methylhydantoinase B
VIIEIDREIDLSQIDELVFDYETNRVLPNSTQQYRDMLVERMVPHWS